MAKAVLTLPQFEFQLQKVLKRSYLEFLTIQDAQKRKRPKALWYLRQKNMERGLGKLDDLWAQATPARYGRYRALERILRKVTKLPKGSVPDYQLLWRKEFTYNILGLGLVAEFSSGLQELLKHFSHPEDSP